jgi:hypothetical protein
MTTMLGRGVACTSVQEARSALKARTPARKTGKE